MRACRLRITFAGTQFGVITPIGNYAIRSLLAAPVLTFERACHSTNCAWRSLLHTRTLSISLSLSQFAAVSTPGLIFSATPYINHAHHLSSAWLAYPRTRESINDVDGRLALALSRAVLLLERWWIFLFKITVRHDMNHGNDGTHTTGTETGKQWHPAKSLIASTTTHGNILIWHCPKAERWGAFAGGFEEVDENIEYEEREDEFDIEDEEVIQERKMKAEEQEVDIDDMDTSPDESPIVPKRSVNNSESSTTAGGGNGTTSKSSPATTTSTSTTSNAALQSKPNSKSNSSSTTTNHVPTTNNSKGKNAPGKMVKAVDEDAAWADEDPDEDVKGWKMHISKGVAELAEELGV
ncbi:hypothetical protein NP233_g10647 [Leucocoprinus birnbaumii]|uniref:Uncharacterized protein n=1 Tax=Leucocoprinus birnbaumii TaxID=56174 RepID=A0AAD5YLZ3_9AGAR|nr:hypothetical protein NP233_g10647 [Leucocoprinus birnbaumii]